MINPYEAHLMTTYLHRLAVDVQPGSAIAERLANWLGRFGTLIGLSTDRLVFNEGGMAIVVRSGINQGAVIDWQALDQALSARQAQPLPALDNCALNLALVGDQFDLDPLDSEILEFLCRAASRAPFISLVEAGLAAGHDTISLLACTLRRPPELVRTRLSVACTLSARPAYSYPSTSHARTNWSWRCPAGSPGLSGRPSRSQAS